MNNLFSYAFRPFFLLNGFFAMLVLALWVGVLHGLVGMPPGQMFWHGHEMIVGFAMATIAGFILTAVATWTDRPPLHGGRLGFLVLVWLLGRLAMALAYLLPAWFVALVDGLFPVLLCVAVAQEVIGGGSRRNYPIVLITALLALLNIFYHLGASELLPGADRIAVYLLIHLVLLLVTVISGRIVPNFSANWLRAHGVERLPETSVTLDRLVIGMTLLTGLLVVFAPSSLLTAGAAFLAAGAHGWRLSRWRGWATRPEPLLFVLHAAYLWLPFGYALTGCAILGWLVPPTAALHALTMGAIGMMILAVTTRVALAHTGRPLHAARLTVVAYVLLAVAVFVRVLSPLSSQYLVMVDVSAAGWIVAFGIFTWVYWPVLIGPRADA
jgi:uncharacterized protein involved in response to NO